MQTLLEVFDSFETADVLQKIKVAVCVDTCADKSVPVDALQLNI